MYNKLYFNHQNKAWLTSDNKEFIAPSKL